MKRKEMNLTLRCFFYLFKAHAIDPKSIVPDFALTYEGFTRSLLGISRSVLNQWSVPFPQGESLV